MKKLLALLLLFGIVGCEQEPTQLEKCVAANLDNLKDIEELNLTNRQIHIDMKFSNIEKIAIFSLIYNKIEDGNINFNDSLVAQMSPIYGELGQYPTATRDEWAVQDLFLFAFMDTYPDVEPFSIKNKESNKEFIKTFQADFIKLQRDEVEPICNTQGIY